MCGIRRGGVERGEPAPAPATDELRYDEPLVPQAEPICAIEPRFCLETPVQLRLREKIMSLSGDDFKVTDESSGMIYFQVQGKVFSLEDEKVLYDNAGVAVLNLKEALFSFTDKYTVYAGKSNRPICQFKTRLVTFLVTSISTTFKDAISGRERLVVLKGDWRQKKCVIFLGDPKQGGIPIAKVFRPLTGRSLYFGVDEYILEVAPGVDVSLMVIMCIALDEHKRDKKSRMGFF